MADQVPGAGAPVAAASTPAAPSTPSTGAAASTGSPATGTEAGSAAATPSFKVGDDPLKFLSDARATADKAAPAEGAKPEGEGDAASAEEAKKADDAAKKAAEEDAAAKDEAAKAEAAKKAEETEDADLKEDEIAELARTTLAEGGPLPPAELAAKLKENPELDAALRKVPELRQQIFHASRLAAKVTEFQEEVGDIETAKFLKENAVRFGDLQEMFSTIDDVDSTRPLIGKLIELTHQVNEDGTPKLDPQTNKPISDGSVGRFMDNIFKMALDFYEDDAKKSGKDDLVAAAQVLKERLSGSSASDEGMSDELKKQQAEIKAEREALDKQKIADLERQHTSFEKAVGDDVDKQVRDLVSGVVNNTNLTDFNKKAAVGQIAEALYENLKNNKVFTNERDALMRRGYGQEVQQKRVALAVRTAKQALRRVAAPILREAGATKLARQDELLSKVAAQVADTQADPKGATKAPPAAQALTPEQKLSQFRKDFQAKNGRQPSELDIVRFVRTSA
jgi:hypothetical protein